MSEMIRETFNDKKSHLRALISGRSQEGGKYDFSF